MKKQSIVVLPIANAYKMLKKLEDTILVFKYEFKGIHIMI